MASTNKLPIQVPLTDGRGMIDRRWAFVISEIQNSQPPSGSGFVTDGSATSYGPMTLFQGVDSAKPGIAEPASFYFALDTGKLYRESSGTWSLFSEALTGDVTKPAGSQVTTLASVFASPGTYGSATQTPVLTVDAKGRLTNLWFENITATAAPGGSNGMVQFNNSGVLSGTGQIFYNTVTGGLTFTNPVPTREALSPLAVKGDIFVRNSTGSTRLPVGAQNQILRADATEATGLKWVDDTSIEVRFNFGDATPKPIATIPANRVVKQATIVILTPFNGPGATLALGSPNELQTTGDNLPGTSGTYDVEPGIQYGVNTAVTLTISPGVSTQGSGLVTIIIEE